MNNEQVSRILCARGNLTEFSKELRNSPKKVDKKRGISFAEIDIREVLWGCFNECRCVFLFQFMYRNKMGYHSVLICCEVVTERTYIIVCVCRYWVGGSSYSKSQFLSPSAGNDFVKKMYKRLVFQNIIEPINIFNLFFPNFLRIGDTALGQHNAR